MLRKITERPSGKGWRFEIANRKSLRSLKSDVAGFNRENAGIKRGGAGRRGATKSERKDAIVLSEERAKCLEDLAVGNATKEKGGRILYKKMEMRNLKAFKQTL